MQESILDTIGETPLVRVDTLSTGEVDVYAKLEGFDPSGSIKGRVARRMIEQAEQDGELSDDTTILEPTSGNTGIALAMVAQYKDYDIVLVMPASMSIERMKIMKAFGADVILTPACDGEDGAIDHARDLVQDDDSYWMPDQFSNEHNIKAHYEGTGPEIWDQTNGDVTHFVAAWGTSGTLMGVGSYLKEQDPGVEIVGVEPESCAIQGLKSFDDGMTPEIYDDGIVDRVIDVEAEEAYRWTDRLVSQEALFMGQSSGANAAAVTRVVDDLDSGTVVTTFCDFGFKYLSADPYDEEDLEGTVKQIRAEERVGRL